MKRGGVISIWFFIGTSLLVNGILIFGASVYQLFNPPQQEVVLVPLSRGRVVGSHPGDCGSDVLHLLRARQGPYLKDFSSSRSSSWPARRT